MRAVRVAGETLEVVELPDPTPGPGDAVVEVERCGICGTDLHLTHPPGAVGLVPGHEVAGRVVEVGAGVVGLRIGQRVAVKPSDPCGTCSACVRERPNACPNQWATHIGLGANGGYAEYLRAPARSCVPVPEHVSAADAALAEPFAVALHGLSLAEPVPAGTGAAVIGAGPIGLLVTAALVTRGVAVTVVEPNPRRAAVASALGAAAVHASSGELDDGGQGSTSLVVECSGAPGTIDDAIRLGRIGARVVLMGISGHPVTIQAGAWLLKEISMSPSVGYSMADFKAGVKAVGDGVVTARKLQTETVGLDAAQRSFEVLRRGEQVKVQLAPEVRIDEAPAANRAA